MTQDPNKPIKLSGPSPEEVDKWAPVKPFVQDDDLDHYKRKFLEEEGASDEQPSQLRQPSLGEVVIRAERADERNRRLNPNNG